MSHSEFEQGGGGGSDTKEQLWVSLNVPTFTWEKDSHGFSKGDIKNANDMGTIPAHPDGFYPVMVHQEADSPPPLGDISFIDHNYVNSPDWIPSDAEEDQHLLIPVVVHIQTNSTNWGNNFQCIIDVDENGASIEATSEFVGIYHPSLDISDDNFTGRPKTAIAVSFDESDMENSAAKEFYLVFKPEGSFNSEFSIIGSLELTVQFDRYNQISDEFGRQNTASVQYATVGQDLEENAEALHQAAADGVELIQTVVGTTSTATRVYRLAAKAGYKAATVELTRAGIWEGVQEIDDDPLKEDEVLNESIVDGISQFSADRRMIDEDSIMNDFGDIGLAGPSLYFSK